MNRKQLIVISIAFCLLTGLGLAQRQPGGGGKHRKPTMDLPPVYADNIPKTDPNLSGKFTFVRLKYDIGGLGSGFESLSLGDGGLPWSHDYPVASRHLMKIMTELSKIDATLDINEPILALDDPMLFKFPFAYFCEVGYMTLSDQEIAGWREYLLRGGFMLIDDFRSTQQFARFQYYAKRAFPEYELKKLDVSHPIFNCFFSIKSLEVPPIYGGGYVSRETLYPEFWGLEDEKGRLMMVINYNYDVSDFWQFSDNPFRPIEETNDAYKFGVNYILYALTH
jgi:hypothetical protein